VRFYPAAGRVDFDVTFASKAYIARATQHLPNAALTFDAFPVIQLANPAVDEVRRVAVNHPPCLRRSRWTWLKDKGKWSATHILQFYTLSRSRLTTASAWRLKESLRELFVTAASPEQARSLFAKRYSWARRARLAPFKRLAATLKTHLQGVLNAFDSGLSNGRVEGINSLIQTAKAPARGYRTTHGLITIDYLIAGNLVHLPVSPYARQRPVRTS